MEQAMEQSGEGDGGDALIATAISEAGARLALAVLRGAQAIAENMGDPPPLA